MPCMAFKIETTSTSSWTWSMAGISDFTSSKMPHSQKNKLVFHQTSRILCSFHHPWLRVPPQQRHHSQRPQTRKSCLWSKRIPENHRLGSCQNLETWKFHRYLRHTRIYGTLSHVSVQSRSGCRLLCSRNYYIWVYLWDKTVLGFESPGNQR